MSPDPVAELKQKIDKHRAETNAKCGPDCWCWPAHELIILFMSAIQANRLLTKQNEDFRTKYSKTREARCCYHCIHATLDISTEEADGHCDIDNQTVKATDICDRFNKA